MTKPTLFLLAAFIFVLDQLTKKWAVSHLPLDVQGMTLIPHVLYFTRTVNTGSAFSMFSGSTSILAVASLAAAVGIVIYIVSLKNAVPVLMGIALALPLGGALGNFLDRARMGHVVDFVQVFLGSYEWPVFNLADSAICIGVVLLALINLRSGEAQRVAPESGPAMEPSAPPNE